MFKTHRIQLSIAVLVACAWVAWRSLRLKAGWSWEPVAPVSLWVSALLAIPLMSALLYFPLRWLWTPESRLDGRIYLSFVFYVAALGLSFSALAPGCFSDDSLYSFFMVKQGWWSGWYSIVHLQIITASFQVIPLGNHAPGALLVLIWALVFCYLHSILLAQRARILVHAAVTLMLLWPALIMANGVIIRDSYFSALALLFMLRCYHVWRCGLQLNASTRWCLGLFGAVLILYRSDALPIVALGYWWMRKQIFDAPPVFKLDRLLKFAPLLKVNHWALRPLKLVALNVAFWAPLLILAFGYGKIPSLFEQGEWRKGNRWHERTEEVYSITLVENPLSYILRQPQVQLEPAEQQALERVYDLQVLRDHYCPQNICAFFGERMKPGVNRESAQAFAAAAFRLFQRYPTLFLESRWATFATVGDDNPITLCNRPAMSAAGYDLSASARTLRPLGEFLETAISQTEGAEGQWGGRAVWWNVSVWSVVLLAIALLGTVRTLFAPEAKIAAMLLARAALVFLATPAGFTSYYLTILIGAPIVLILLIAQFSRRKDDPYAHRVQA
jgi:hypothetical protein